MTAHLPICAGHAVRTLVAFAAGVFALVSVQTAVAADSAPVVPPPQRIVSLNLCIDQILIDLVARERIAGLSFLAHDPSMSMVHRQASGIPGVQANAEQVLALNPDLVLASEWSATATVDLLRRLGRRVEIVPMASTFAEIRSLVRHLANLTGSERHGEHLVREFDQRLANVRSRLPSAPRPRAVAMQVNSLAAGPGSLVDEVFHAAGFDNLAASLPRGRTGRLPLESLIAHPPDVIVLANSPDDFRTVLADNLRHPAFRALQSNRPVLHVPMREWLCGTPSIANAVERLASQHARVARQVTAP